MSFRTRIWKRLSPTTISCFLTAALTLAAGSPADWSEAFARRSLPDRESIHRSDSSSAEIEAIDGFISDRFKGKGVVGLSVGMLQTGKVVFAKGYGQSSIARGTPVGANTMFAIGSVTKQFTSACILLLQQEGKLSVNDKVSKYYPDLTSAKQITILDLMSMQSGYPDYYPLDFVDRRMARPIHPDRLIRQYATGKLDFPPETRWSYSNTGYIILGRIVERVSGLQFGIFLLQRIFRPLQMEHTAYQPLLPSKVIARGYTSFALGPPEPATPEANGWASTAGGIYSTPTDLLKWDLALMDGKVLKQDSYRLMTTSRKLRDGKETGYGCGQGIRNVNGVTVLSHGGAVSGFVASNILVPSTRSAIVILNNYESSEGLGPLGGKMLASLLPKTEEAAKPEAENKQDKPKPVGPQVSGLAAADAAKRMLAELQSGELDRKELGEEFSYFLSPAKLRGASQRLKDYGDPSGAEAQSLGERGGMEVTSVRFTFKTESLTALMYRSPDGKIQEFLVTKN